MKDKGVKPEMILLLGETPTSYRVVVMCDGAMGGSPVRRRPLCQVIALRGTFRVMAFAQLTYRESLRNIEACLSTHTSELYHMGFRETRDAVRRERIPRLAHLRRLRPGADPSGRKTLCGGELPGGTVRNGLRAQLDYNRSMPVGFPVGAFSRHQGLP